MGQGKTGWWIAGICAVIVLISVGYGMGRRAALHSADSAGSLSPAGVPPAIQIEPIQPQAELAAITVSPAAESQNQPAAAVAPASAAASSSAPMAEDSARVREIQRALKTAGFDPGSTDGRMGPRTHTAIRDFQRANGLEPDGKVGPRTWAKLESFLKQASTTSHN